MESRSASKQSSGSFSPRSSEAEESVLKEIDRCSMSRSSETTESISFRQAEIERCSQSQSKLMDSHMKLILEQMSQISALVDGMDEMREEFENLKSATDERFGEFSSRLESQVVRVEQGVKLEERVLQTEKSLADESKRLQEKMMEFGKVINELRWSTEGRLGAVEQMNAKLHTHCEEREFQYSTLQDGLDKFIEACEVVQKNQAEELESVNSSIKDVDENVNQLISSMKQESTARRTHQESLQARIAQTEMRNLFQDETQERFTLELNVLEKRFCLADARLAEVEDFRNSCGDRFRALEAVLDGGEAIGRPELCEVTQKMDDKYSKIKAQLELQNEQNVTHSSELEHRVEFLESKIRESVDAVAKKIDNVDALAQQQRDLSARISGSILMRTSRTSRISTNGAH